MSSKSNELLLAQELFDKAVIHIMDLNLTDEVTKAIGVNMALSTLNEIVNRNTDEKLMDLYCGVRNILVNEDVEL